MIKRTLVVGTWRASSGAAPQSVAGLGFAIDQFVSADARGSVLDTGDQTTAVVLHRLPQGSSDPLEILLFSLRDPSGLPIQYTPGQPVRDFHLADGTFAGDVAHVVMWDDGLIAQDWYRDVPRVTRLSQYLRKQLSIKLETQPLYDRNLAEELKDIKGRLRSVSLSNNAQHPRSYSGTFGTLIPSALGDKVPKVNVSLGMGRSGPRDQYLPENVSDAVYDEIERGLDQFDSFILHGRSRRTGKIVEINLLKRRIGAQVELPATDGVPGLPEAEATFRALRQTVRERADALLEARVLSISAPL